MTTTVCLANEYYEMLRECDKSADTEQTSASSTTKMIQSINKQKDCHKAVVYKIIDTEYTKNKQQMKSEFDNFIKNSHDITYSMQYPDKCIPDCGTIVGLNAANANLEIIKTYVHQLLYTISEKH